MRARPCLWAVRASHGPRGRGVVASVGGRRATGFGAGGRPLPDASRGPSPRGAEPAVPGRAESSPERVTNVVRQVARSIPRLECQVPPRSGAAVPASGGRGSLQIAFNVPMAIRLHNGIAEFPIRCRRDVRLRPEGPRTRAVVAVSTRGRPLLREPDGG